MSDVTYARVEKDFYAICTYMDLFSRKIVGYGIAPENNCDLVSRTFLQAYADSILFYNSKRPHRKLNLRTPDQCEREYENSRLHNQADNSN